MIEVLCNLCGAADGEPLHVGPDRLLGHPGSFQLVQCRNCGLIYLNPRPVDIAPFYDGSYLPFTPPPRRTTFGARAPSGPAVGYGRILLQATGLAGGALLDVGCATGDFLLLMHAAGWQVSGCDPSAAAVEVARQRLPVRLRQRVVAGPVEAAGFAPGSFDVVSLWHTIEHLPDPLATLRELRRLLRPGGVLLLQTPAWLSLESQLWGRYWSGFDCPRHLYVFSAATLTALLAKAGFQVQRQLLAPSYYLWLVSLLFYLRERAPGRLASWLYRLLGRGPFMYAFAPFFKVIDSIGLGSHLTLSAVASGPYDD